MTDERKRRSLPWVALLMVPVLGGGIVWYLRAREPPLAVETVRVERGEVREIVTSAAAGEVRAERRVLVRSEIAATVLSTKKRQGDRVTAGELCVTFQSDELDARLAQAQANVEAARVTVVMAETRLAHAARALDRAKRLKASDAISEVELERAETEHSALQQGVEQARAAEKQARAAMKLAEVARRRSAVHAPFAGVLQEVFAEVGVQVAPGAPLFDLLDDTSVTIDVPVDEADVSRIFVGQRVTLKSDSQPGRPIAGTVRLIPPAVGRSSERGALETSVIAQKERLLYVEVEPDEPKELRVGASVNAEFLVSVRADVLYVPSHVVLGRGVLRSVFRVQGGRAIKAPFEAGLVSWERTEVRSGLEEGAEVIASLNVKGLEEGARVEVSPKKTQALDEPGPASDMSAVHP